jgi:hypothetical protein
MAVLLAGVVEASNVRRRGRRREQARCRAEKSAGGGRNRCAGLLTRCPSLQEIAAVNARSACRSLIAAALLALAASPAAAAIYVFGASLDGPSEAPPVASPGTGTAVVTFNTDNASAPTMRVETSFSGLLAGVTVAHIHCCTAAAGTGTAGVATPTPTFPGFPAGVTSGSYDQTFDLSLASSWNAAFLNNVVNGGNTANAFNTFFTGVQDGKAYLNIHSSQFPSGEIRGFLEPIPEPGTYALMAVGLAMMGWLGRTRLREARHAPN